MTEPISPWSDSSERISPDGRFRAVIRGAQEIRMGAPTSGTLTVEETALHGRTLSRLSSCSPSFVWSNRSDAVAVPQWTQTLDQRLVTVSVPDGHLSSHPNPFRVLELHSFVDGIIRGVDSPVHEPLQVEVPAPTSPHPTPVPIGLVLASTLAWLWGIVFALSNVALGFPTLVGDRASGPQGVLDVAIVASVAIAIALCYAGYGLRRRRRAAGWVAVCTGTALMLWPLFLRAPIATAGGVVSLAIVVLTIANWRHLAGARRAPP